MRIFLLLFLSGCAPIKASEGVRIVPTLADDARSCYVLYQDGEARGVTCPQ